MNLLNRFTRDRNGSTATLFAISLPVIIGGVAMMVEMGHWWYSKTKLQATADMAAIAGARELMLTQSFDQIYNASIGDAYENGYDANAGTLVLESPPKTGAYIGYRGVEVNIVEQKERLLTSLFSDQPVTISVRAVALSTEPKGDACILSLDRSNDTTIEVDGTADIDVSGCEIRANSTGIYSVDTQGSGSIKADCVRTSGTVGANENITVTTCNRVSENERPIDDPYADIEVPIGVNALPCETPTKINKWAIGLKSGRYCKSNIVGIDLVDLETGGTFIFDGVDLNMKSSFAHLKGTDVTLIFMNGAKFVNANGGLLELSAKDTGPYAGIVFYADRHTSDPTDHIHFSGNQNAKIEGVLYFPTQTLDFAGGGNLRSECTILIANRISLTGNSNMTNNDCGRLGLRGLGGTNGGVALFE